LPVEFHEETLTSREAESRLPPGAAPEEVDRVAAAVLLEDFLRHGKALR
jgi:RNase H-fold protein (predicted Holliday junction resolvase)